MLNKWYFSRLIIFNTFLYEYYEMLSTWWMKPTWSIFCFPFFFEIFDTGHEKTDGQSKFKIKNCLPRFFNFVWLQARCQITSVSAFLFYCKWTAAVLRVFFNSNKNIKKCPSVSVYYCLVFSICKWKEKKNLFVSMLL